MWIFDHPYYRIYLLLILSDYDYFRVVRRVIRRVRRRIR